MHSSFLASIGILTVTQIAKASPILRRATPDYQIQWIPCTGLAPPSLECGELQVPLDWDSPDGDTITIGLSRINATNQDSKIGSLIFNPGGPGGVATDVCLGQAFGVPFFGEGVIQNFDIVCPDPRGVGKSTPVVCDPEVWNEYVSSLPSTQDEFDALVAANKAKGDSCRNLTGPLLEHLDTINVAKDFEAVRLALDDGLLNYLGLSYGSLIGTTYAQLYPENIRAMAIDGILDHTQSPTTTFLVETTAYENVLDRFFEWCANSTDTCGLTGEDLPGMFDDLIESANNEPIPAPGCLASNKNSTTDTCRANVTGDDIRFTAQGFLLFKDGLANGIVPGWSSLGLALNQSITSNNATLFSPPLALTNTSALYPAIAIACLDFDPIDLNNTLAGNNNNSSTSLPFSQLLNRQRLGNSLNPHVGPASQSYTIQSSCTGWPIPVTNPFGSLNTTAFEAAPQILMVNADHDPSTSYSCALIVEEQVPGAVLLTREGDGHTSYFLRGEAAAAIDAYLVNGTLPDFGSVVDS